MQIHVKFPGVDDCLSACVGVGSGCGVVEFGIWTVEKWCLGPRMSVKDEIGSKSTCLLMRLAKKDADGSERFVEGFPVISVAAAWRRCRQGVATLDT